MKLLRKILFSLVGVYLLYIIGVLIFGTVKDYQPPPAETLSRSDPATVTPIRDSILRLTIWNIGYCGLGAESDFFYDNGGFFLAGRHSVRSSRDLVNKNLNGIKQVASGIQSDFYLFQETDKGSKRSYFINEFEELGKQMEGYHQAFGLNYLVDFVPLPLLEPWRAYGRTESGLATYSRYEPVEAVRRQLPGNYAWPTRIFQLDRCALVQRYPLQNGKELLLLNIHNSAYDELGKLKTQQLDFLKKIFLEAYEAGNYVIAGGDWNECPPYFRFDGFMPDKTQGYRQLNIDPDFMPPGWKWVYDPGIPTNRKNKTAYQPGETFVTIIDFYLISPNIRVRSVKTVDTGFRFSDHQPVWMEVELN